MVDPPPTIEQSVSSGDPNKASLRRELGKRRRAHVAALPDAVRALVFGRPPASALSLVPDRAVVGLYHPVGAEAPTLGYAKWLYENGSTLALPWFADRQSDMEFRAWSDPYDDAALEPGPHGHLQPAATSAQAGPDVLFVPMIGFTARGDRLGRGGGHYDRWLEAHPHVPAIGLAWDCQQVDALPLDPHDRQMAMVVTPARVHSRSL